MDMTVEEFLARHGTRKLPDLLRAVAKQAWAERRASGTGDRVEAMADDLERLLRTLSRQQFRMAVR